MIRWTHLSASLAAGSVVAAALAAVAQQPLEYRPVTVIAKRFPTIQNAPHRTADEVGEELRPNELVIGVLVGNEARAYPINMLTGPRREIINDTLGGQAIAATW